MATEILTAEIVLEDAQLVAAGRRTERVLNSVSAGMLKLSGDAVRTSSSLQLIDASTGQFVSTTQALNAVGVQTTAQIQQQAAALQFLKTQVEGDTLAFAQLEAMQRRLASSGKQLGRVPRQLGNNYTQLAFILNDVQQFGMGARQGIVAVSNQIPQLINMFGLAAKFAGPLAVGLTVVSSAFVLLGRNARGSVGDVKAMSDALESVAQSAIKLPDQVQFRIDEAGAVKAIAEEEARLVQMQERRRDLLAGAANLLQRQRFIDEKIGPQPEDIAVQKTVVDQLRTGLGTLRAQERVTAILSQHFTRISSDTDKIAKRGLKGLFAFGGTTPVEPTIKGLERTGQLMEEIFGLPRGAGLGFMQELVIPLEMANQQAPILTSQFRVMQAEIGAVLRDSEVWADTLSTGIANILTGLGSMKDLLSDIQFTLRDVIRDIIRIGLVRLISGAVGGILGGPAGAAAGAAAPSGFRVVELRARGSDLVAVINEQNALSGS